MLGGSSGSPNYGPQYNYLMGKANEQSKLLAEQNSLLRIANCRREREVKEGFSFGYHSCNLLRTNCIWLSGPDSKESIQ